MRISPLLAVLLAAAMLLAPTAPAFAQSADSPRWTCRASTIYLRSDQSPRRVEPFVANGTSGEDPSPDRAFCADDEAGLPTLSVSQDQGSATGQGPFARTDIDPDFSDTHAQRATAEAGVGKVRIQNADASFVLTADVARSEVVGSCSGRSPSFNTNGSVVNVTINGNAVSPDSAFEQMGTGFNGSPLGGRIQVFFNEVESRTSDDGRDQYTLRRAIHARILDGDGKVLLEAVVAEAKADRHEAVCTPPPELCPPGSSYDPETGMCVIVREVPREDGACPAGTTEGTGGRCIETIYVGKADDAGSGGLLVVLGDVAVGASPCKAKRFGRQFAIVGTNRGDRITGSNKSDRIFGYGGNDRVSGGRGNECIEGGSGSDQLDGSNGTDYLLGGFGNDNLQGGQRGDRLYGGPGRDKLTGGSGGDLMEGAAGNDKLSGGLGNDRLYGGKGNDEINTGNGTRDRVKGGDGNDSINAATAGPPARIDCGRGFDTVRINFNERSRIRNCERVFVISLTR